MKRVFIDGKEGTTGLRIYDRLEKRDGIELILLSEEDRKNPEARKKALNSCDIAFLCLPDAASIEAVSMIENPDVKVIDASTAHRTNPIWTYGLPELSDELFLKVKNSKRVAVPGCHASGLISLIYPLIQNKIISSDIRLCCHSLTGYSGGGKKMISEYESAEKNALLNAPLQYGLTQQHKHLKEMIYISGLVNPPVFCPIVSDFYSGMLLTVSLFKEDLLNGAKAADIKCTYNSIYKGPVITFVESANENGFMSACSLAGSDAMQITVEGNEDRILLIARYDNLGKGASGAAIQCMNIMTCDNLTEGLTL